MRPPMLDKPKSLVLFLGCLFAGLLVFLPMAVIGLSLEKVTLFLAGSAGIAATWLPAAFMALLFAAGLYAGNYRELRRRPWREQVW